MKGLGMKRGAGEVRWQTSDVRVTRVQYSKPRYSGFSPDTPGLMSGVSGLPPGVSGFWLQTHFQCVNKLSYAFTPVSQHTYTHPTVNYIKSNFDLYLVAII